ncbi:MAG: uncharacterized protein KVP18_004351, partial [Porospora cf. gigantea A]|uniref:uncharacterized protein n=1 Tax=Porospora cf. gigantea A TaxID=2853593 RepID=UPI00355A4D2E
LGYILILAGPSAITKNTYATLTNFYTLTLTHGGGKQEAFAIIEGVRKFDPFLRGRAFTVHTDHASLRWMLQATKGKVARWASRLAEYDMTIFHKSGTSLAHVDFLSRYLDTDADPGLEPRMTLRISTSRTAS